VGSSRGKGGSCERVEDDQALEVGNGRCKQGLQPGFSSAPVAGFAHTEVLEVVNRRQWWYEDPRGGRRSERPLAGRLRRERP
jgi:hypothetical protein